MIKFTVKNTRITLFCICRVCVACDIWTVRFVRALLPIQSLSPALTRMNKYLGG